MKESILHYIWQNKLFESFRQLTTDGQELEIIDIGQPNSDSGPDFFNAKIKIENTIWAGNVEIHTRASDWKKHNHHSDKAYDSVILHVVKFDDAEIFRTDGEKIPQLVLKYADSIEQNYNSLLSEVKWIPCADKISEVPSIFLTSWKNALLTERLWQKTLAINGLLTEYVQHWEEAFYVSLARSFGFNTNSDAFEMLAKSIPLLILSKHKDNLFQLEALLFGQAGLLDVDKKDEYVTQLSAEYKHLKFKYDLKSLDGSKWKMLRLRPDNFPHIRIAQFAAIIFNSTKLFSKIIETPELKYLEVLFKVEPSAYWKNHYTFNEESVNKNKKLGKASVDSLIINTVVPFVFSYALCFKNDLLKDKALLLLEKIPAERNSITIGWQNLGIEVQSAYDSQAFLQLKKMYCDNKKCLRCRIGHKVLSKKQ